MIQLDHIAIACNNVERMRSWYEKVLGFAARASKAPSRPDAPASTYLIGPAESPVTLELMPEDRKGAQAREPFTRGLSHIALAVDDFKQWEARITRARVRWLGPAGEAMGGGTVRSFLDPEGNMLQIVQRPAAATSTAPSTSGDGSRD